MNKDFARHDREQLRFPLQRLEVNNSKKDQIEFSVSITKTLGGRAGKGGGNWKRIKEKLQEKREEQKTGR